MIHEVLTGFVAHSSPRSSRQATGEGCRDLYDLCEQLVHVQHFVHVVAVVGVAEVAADVAFPDFSWALTMFSGSHYHTEVAFWV